MTTPGADQTDSIFRTLVIVAALIICAAIPRLYHLGSLSFYMDEETTAFASKSLAEGKSPQMPSGMPYHRSLPHTALNALSARFFGINEEFSYRLPGALLGILTVPLLFLVARPYVGMHAALLAALLLAFSEWHILTSRQARMYAPFLFFYVACAFSIFKWSQQDSNRNLIIAAVLFITTTAFHNLGVFAAFIPLVALHIKGFVKTPQYKLIAFSIIGGISAYLYGERYVGLAYQRWTELNAIQPISASGDSAINLLFPDSISLMILGLIGMASGFYLARKSTFPDTLIGASFRILTRYVLAITAGWFAGTGHIYGASMALVVLLLQHPDNIAAYIRKTYVPLILLASLSVIAVVMEIIDYGIVQGMKNSLSYPYPYWIVIGEISPVLTLMFAGIVIYLALSVESENNRFLKVNAIAGLFPLLLVGISMKWAPARYLNESYPFILVSCAPVLLTICNHVTGKYFPGDRKIYLAIAYLISLSGLIGGHGLYPAYKAGTVTHGSKLNEAALIFPVYPDHKFPGEYVARNLRPGDLVIAEDALQQKWYAGQVDYWLRNYQEESGFLYIASDHQLHDIYVDSIAATYPILSKLLADKSRRIWIITSGETYSQRNFYLNDKQREWLNSIESSFKPVYTGHDSITQVYCIHCNSDINR